MSIITLANETIEGAASREDTQLLSLEQFAATPDATGVLLEVDEEVEALLDRLNQLELVALDFPAFSDGRHYSSARMLRQKGFEGNIRAIGDVRLDQLEQMARCGFNQFELATGQAADKAAERLQGFSYSYQQTADRQPLFLSR